MRHPVEARGHRPGSIRVGIRLNAQALSGHVLVEASAWLHEDQALQVFDKKTGDVLVQRMTDPAFPAQRVWLKAILHGTIEDIEARIVEVPSSPKVSFG